ncbi:MAG: pimeloyl-ACP methyl ester carboxylesterase [Flavobacterium sp.]|jgi:pimeloyl-ACP methyl ester carboxylesterase
MPHAIINGAKLWYTSMGEDTAKAGPILLHHGYTACRANWMPVAERLQSRFKIILMECRGSGESEDTLGGYDLPQLSDDVVGLVDHLGIEKFTYAGHSMGGGMGYLLGLNHPERLHKLILMAPIPSGGISAIPNQAYVERRLKAKREKNRAFFKDEMIATRFRQDVQTDAWFESRVDNLLRVSESHVLDGMQSMFDLNVQSELGNINMPTLMLAGAVDGLIKANLEDYLRLPDATLHVFSRAGHDVAIHEPDGVSKAIDDFMIFGALSESKLQNR